MYSYHSTVMFERKRTSVELVMYALYLYFLGLSFRNTSKALEPFEEKRSHVSVWNWVQRFNPKKIYPRKRKRRVTAFIIDETVTHTDRSDAWLLVAFEPVHSIVLGVFLSRHKYTIVIESFLRSLVKVYEVNILYFLMVEQGILKDVLLPGVLSIKCIDIWRKV